MESIEQQLLQFISTLYASMQWPGVVFLMAIESACIPVPSELIMPLAGWMLIKAYSLPVEYVLVAGFYGGLGNLLGSVVAYWVGLKKGRPFLEKYGRYLLISRHDLDRADEWFEKWGNWSAFISRVMPVIRTFISLPAGIARMHFGRFCVYSFAGSFIWSVGLAYGGYVLGENWERLRAAMRPFDLPIIAVLVVLAGYYVYRHIKHVSADGRQDS